jgi:hypothetical protein
MPGLCVDDVQRSHGAGTSGDVRVVAKVSSFAVPIDLRAVEWARSTTVLDHAVNYTQSGRSV